MPTALGVAKRALRIAGAPFRLANRHQWLTSALIIGATLAYLVLSALLLPIPQVQGAYTIGNSMRFRSGSSRIPGRSRRRRWFARPQRQRAIRRRRRWWRGDGYGIGHAGNQYAVTVGAGGAGGNPATTGTPDGGATNGGDSSFGSITATGGGWGGAFNGNSGGSGGGGNGGTGLTSVGGAGVSGQGNNGGGGWGTAGQRAGGGGGGAGSAGADGAATTGGNGGSGLDGSTLSKQATVRIILAFQEK